MAKKKLHIKNLPELVELYRNRSFNASTVEERIIFKLAYYMYYSRLPKWFDDKSGAVNRLFLSAESELDSYLRRDLAKFEKILRRPKKKLPPLPDGETPEKKAERLERMRKKHITINRQSMKRNVESKLSFHDDNIKTKN